MDGKHSTLQHDNPIIYISATKTYSRTSHHGQTQFSKASQNDKPSAQRTTQLPQQHSMMSYMGQNEQA